MSNELLLISSVFVIYLSLLLWFYLFGKSGLYAFTVLATIAANIEVLILIKAFGIEQTLGNVLFASTFLATDILSETHDKKTAKKAVRIGLMTSVTFIVFSQFWLYYTPSPNDFAFDSIVTIFKNTPRLMISSLVVYLISQFYDVWIYHKIWDLTTKKSNDRKKYLWLRNNLSTLSSQLINTVLFTLFAFYGVYDLKTLTSIFIASYIIFVFTSLIDTPVIYAARKLHELKKIKE